MPDLTRETAMKRMLATAMVLIATTAGVAQAYSPGSSDIDRRQANQERRIEHGLRDGSLTRGEAHRLTDQQRRIDQMEREARRDGYVSQREAAEIRRAQNFASRSIWRERHDYDTRGYRGYGWGWGRWW